MDPRARDERIRDTEAEAEPRHERSGTARLLEALESGILQSSCRRRCSPPDDDGLDDRDGDEGSGRDGAGRA